MSQIDFDIWNSLERTPDIPQEKTGLSELSAKKNIKCKIDFDGFVKNLVNFATLLQGEGGCKPSIRPSPDSNPVNWRDLRLQTTTIMTKAPGWIQVGCLFHKLPVQILSKLNRQKVQIVFHLATAIWSSISTVPSCLYT